MVLKNFPYKIPLFQFIISSRTVFNDSSYSKTGMEERKNISLNFCAKVFVSSFENIGNICLIDRTVGGFGDI